MKKLTSYKYPFKMRPFFYLAVMSYLFLGLMQPIRAQSLVTFAQFLEKTGSQDFVFTNNTNNAVFGTVSGGSPIDFRYSNISGLDPALQGFQNAHLSLSTSTNQPTTASGSTLTQAFNGGVSTIQVIRDTPAPVGNGARTNLLTVTFSPNNNSPSLAGSNFGNSASFSATTPDHTVTLTSDFLDFSNSSQRNLALSFSSLLTDLRMDAGNFLKSFTAAGSGTFASNPPPTVVAVPTAAAVSVSGRVLTPKGSGLRNAQVVLTEANGTTHTVMSGISGQYRFMDVRSGQSVVLSVHSKRYLYPSRVFSLTDNLEGLDFLAQP